MKKPLFYALNNVDEINSLFPEVKSAFIIKDRLNWFLMYQMPEKYFKDNERYNCKNIFPLSLDKAKELLSNKAVKSVCYYGN